MALKLSSRQQAQIGFLDQAFSKVQRVQSLIERMASPSETETANRSLARFVDEIKSGASGMGLSRVAESAANIGSISRRSGALPEKLRNLREGLAGLKINWEGARKAASTPEKESDEVE
jgi:hypothetical protein